jgi:hypothetical protein
MKPLPRLSFSGAVDGDGHVLEPPDLWLQYLEPRKSNQFFLNGKFLAIESSSMHETHTPIQLLEQYL